MGIINVTPKRQSSQVRKLLSYTIRTLRPVQKALKLLQLFVILLYLTTTVKYR